MQGVPQPLGPARAPIALVLVACALAAAGCGDSGDGDARADDPVRPAHLPAGFNIQTFDCAGWNAADEGVREYVLGRLHEIANDQVTGPGVQTRGTVLGDDEATKMLDKTCSSPRARGFVLYKLYAFSRGFRGRVP